MFHKTHPWKIKVQKLTKTVTIKNQATKISTSLKMTGSQINSFALAFLT